MAWCPRCGEEYIEGIEYCKKCDVELVNELPNNKEVEKRFIESVSAEKEAFLVNTEDLVEFEYITTVLKEMGISYRAIKNTDQYIDVMGGTSFNNISIYVDQSKLVEAKQILKPLNEKQLENEEILDYVIDAEQEELIEQGQEYSQQEVIKKYRRAFLYALLSPIGIIFAIGIVLVFIALVYKIVSFIIN